MTWRRSIALLLLLGVSLSSVEILWAEGADPVTPTTAAEVLSMSGGGPVLADSGRELPPDNCPCLCACACTGAQIATIPDATVLSAGFVSALPAFGAAERIPRSRPADPRLRPPLA